MRDIPIGALALISSTCIREGSPEATAFKSAPAQKVPCSPHNTPTLASSSFSNSVNAFAKARKILYCLLWDCVSKEKYLMLLQLVYQLHFCYFFWIRWLLWHDLSSLHVHYHPSLFWMRSPTPHSNNFADRKIRPSFGLIALGRAAYFSFLSHLRIPQAPLVQASLIIEFSL